MRNGGKMNNEFSEFLDESLKQKMNECLGADMTGIDATSTSTSTRLTMEIMKEKILIVGAPKPMPSLLDFDAIRDLNPLRDPESLDAFRYAHVFPHVFRYANQKPMRTITKQIQARSHKKKRINKKWLKIYGTKEVSRQVEYTPFVLSGSGI
jgi:hypothetical protein